MFRRDFINVLGALAASAVLDPERLLWVPGKKRIFIPSPSQQAADLQVFVNGVLQMHNRDYWVECETVHFATVPNEAEMVVTIRRTDVAWDWHGDFSRGLPID